MASDKRRAGIRRSGGLLGCLFVQMALTANARGEDEVPDVDLLAYLGSWAGPEEDWVAVAEWDGKADDTAPEDPAPIEEEEDE